jgi:hypothetical protein
VQDLNDQSTSLIVVAVSVVCYLYLLPHLQMALMIPLVVRFPLYARVCAGALEIASSSDRPEPVEFCRCAQAWVRRAHLRPHLRRLIQINTFIQVQIIYGML